MFLHDNASFYQKREKFYLVLYYHEEATVNVKPLKEISSYATNKKYIRAIYQTNSRSPRSQAPLTVVGNCAVGLEKMRLHHVSSTPTTLRIRSKYTIIHYIFPNQ